MSQSCPHCGCPLTDRMTVCPNCGTPKAPPVVGVDTPEEAEIKKVGRFGLVVTSILIATMVLIVVVGVFLTFVTGCCGACNFNSPPPQRPENPLAKYLAPIIAGIVALWVVLAIVVFVIKRRRQ